MTLILNEYSHREKNVTHLIPPTHLGKGGSILYAATFASASKKYLAYMDSDLAADPAELGRLLQHIGGSDIVIGSRVLRGSLGLISRPKQKSFFSYIYSKLSRTLFRIKIYDPQRGLKLFRQEVITSVFEGIRTTGFAFDTDLIVSAYAKGLQVKEIPIIWTHGKSSKLHILREIKKMGTDLFSIWYDCHISWKDNKICYPQKGGSMMGKTLFAILSLIK